MSTKRLFFSLWPNDRQREQLRNVISPIAKLVEGRAVYRDGWHVTLAFVGDFPESRTSELQAAAAEIPFEPFRLRFDHAEYWPRAKVGVLSPQRVPPELESLVGRLNGVLADAGITPEDRVYRPHITIVRAARPFETQRLAQPLMTEWTGFELIESISSRGSSKYYPVKQ
ncbi:MAG: RNA 2',3'-cyclic phosphodiesterase [Woeseiaceae bacterium]|nr:RNA 2',3'-cyclic phosphodiesterase [Woeseiaceae bacterium]